VTEILEARGDQIDVITTRWHDHVEDAPWLDGVELLDRRRMTVVQFLVRFVRRARAADAVVIVGALGYTAGYLDLIAGIALKTIPRRSRPVLVVTEATWEPTSRSLARRHLGWVAPIAARIFIRALDGPHVVYCVLSEEERIRFPILWRVADERVTVTAYHITRSEHVLEAPSVDEGYLFAGGDPLRDYDLLLEATKDLDIPVRIASRYYIAPPRQGLEVGPVDPETYLALEGNAKAIVVPMQTRTPRSAGQQTYLNALARGKPLIVTDAPGVRDYLVADRHALVVGPRPDDLRSAIEYVFDPRNAPAVAEMAREGQRWVRERFPFSRYKSRILQITDEAVRTWKTGAIDLMSIARDVP
jgi:Glycosyl transferases group 1